jgi:hypothetical protein
MGRHESVDGEKSIALPFWGSDYEFVMAICRVHNDSQLKWLMDGNEFWTYPGYVGTHRCSALDEDVPLAQRRECGGKPHMINYGPFDGSEPHYILCRSG